MVLGIGNTMLLNGSNPTVGGVMIIHRMRMYLWFSSVQSRDDDGVVGAFVELIIASD